MKAIQCRVSRVPRTTSPAKCVDGRTVNAVCATTGKKIRAPSQTTKASSIVKRRKAMRISYQLSAVSFREQYGAAGESRFLDFERSFALRTIFLRSE
jgi:hypothetical protein